MKQYGESVWYRDRSVSYPFGLIRSPRYLLSATGSNFRNLFRKSGLTATDHYRATYGSKLADEIAIPITEAWSGCPATELSASVGQKFTTSLPRMMMLKAAGRVTGRTVAVGYSSTVTESPHVWHVYRNGGISTVCERLADPIREQIRMELQVDSINVDGDRVVGIRVMGQSIAARAVISTAPVTLLPKLVHGTDSLRYLERFRCRAMVFVNLKFDGPSGLSDVVTWTPETKYPFFRVSDIGMGLPWLVPEGKSQVTCDIGCQIGDVVWTASESELAERCLVGLEEMIPSIRSRSIGHRVVRTGLAYPIYRQEYESDRLRFERGTGINGLISVGRNGEFSHSLMEDVYWRTRWKVARLINP